MRTSPRHRIGAFVFAASFVATAPLWAAEDAATQNALEKVAGIPSISPEASAVLDRMTNYLRTLKQFAIDSTSSRDEVVDYGYKIQHNQHVSIVASLPTKLRADTSGDLANRSYIYDGAKLILYSPDDSAYARTDAPDRAGQLIENMLDAGVDMPLIDVLYQATQGKLAEGARGGILVGDATIDGAPCDHIAVRQAAIDWQLWVEKGEKALPRKLVITTRYEFGEPQFQATLRWDLKPKIDATTFAFKPPQGVNEVPFVNAAPVDTGE